jgi:hypothetical protein
MSIVQLRRVRVLAPREANVEGLKFADVVDVEVAMVVEEVSGCLFAAIMLSSQIHVGADLDADVEAHV